MSEFMPPEDDLAVGGLPNEAQQGSLARTVERLQALISLHYEYLPVFFQSTLLSLVQDHFAHDPDYRYDRHQPLNNTVLITREWSRSTLGQRDNRPIVSVGFLGSQASHMALRDTMSETVPNAFKPTRTASIEEVSTFQIAVIDHNAVRATVLAQRLRARLVATRLQLQRLYKLQDLGMPTLNGPQNVEEFDDLFQVTMALQIMSLPRWTETQDHDYLRRIAVLTHLNATDLFSEMLLPDAPKP